MVDICWNNECLVDIIKISSTIEFFHTFSDSYTIVCFCTLKIHYIPLSDEFLLLECLRYENQTSEQIINTMKIKMRKSLEA